MLFVSSQHKLFSLLVLVLLRVVVDLEVKVESREARCGIYTPTGSGHGCVWWGHISSASLII